MSFIKINNLNFSYPNGLKLFSNLNLIIDNNNKFGFVGRNGYGKSTLLNILLNHNQYKEIETKYDFIMFPFDVEEDSIVRDIINFYGNCYEEYKIEIEFNLFSLPLYYLDYKFSELSKGTQTQIKLICIFLNENKFYLLDEPTTHLDIVKRELLAKYLNSKKGFILVSHDRTLLDKVTTHTLAINKNTIDVYKGSYSTYKSEFDKQNNFEISKNKNLTKEIKKLNVSAKEKSDWSDIVESTIIGSIDKGFVSHKSAKMMKRSKVIESHMKKNIEDKESLLKNVETTQLIKFHNIPYQYNNLLNIQDLSFSYLDKPILSKLSFQVNKGDKIIINGLNGSGKSTLFKIITKELNDYSGILNINNGVVIEYLPQSFQINSITLKDFVLDNDLIYKNFISTLIYLGFDPTLLNNNISQFSDGEKKKIMLSKMLNKEANLYLVDEPTNYLDIYAIEQLETSIQNSNITIMIIDHDKTFVDSISNKIVNLDK